MLQFWLGIYSFLYTLALFCYLPVYIFRIRFRGRQGVDLLQRLGRKPEWMLTDGDPPHPRLWVHAVSVGEVNAVRPLVDELNRASSLVVSTTTNTGQALARQLFVDGVKLFYFPLDWQWTCRTYLKALRPSAVILTEVELWPGLLAAASSLGIPVVLVNGRLSERSFLRYRRLRFLIAPLLKRMEALCMQSLADKKRMLALGAREERVHWTGNLKYDYSLRSDSARENLARQVERILRKGEGRTWLCGSTREGEEEILLACLTDLRRDFPALRMVLVPRHPHRCDEIEALIKSLQLTSLRRSRLDDSKDPDSPPDVLIVDTIGDLAYLYEIADIVFVGGSLFPTGGHNIIEAAYFGRAILFGPHMENFQAVSKAFLDAYAALQIQTAEELQSRILHLLRDPTAARWLGRNARKVMRDNQGAVRKTLKLIEPLVEESATSRDTGNA